MTVSPHDDFSAPLARSVGKTQSTPRRGTPSKMLIGEGRFLEGRGGAPGTVPLQNPEVTSPKACLRNADLGGAL